MAEAEDTSLQTPEASETEARETGWAPLEDFRGDKSKWVDAETWLARGKHVMPLLRKNNELLRGENKQAREKIVELERRVAEGETSMKDVLEFHKEALAGKVKEARKQLITELQAAKDSEEPDALATAIANLSAFDSEQALAKVAPVKKLNGESKSGEEEEPHRAAPKVEPWFTDWLAENPWADEAHEDFDRRRSRMANVIAGELRSDPKHKNLKGAAFLDKVTEMTDAELGGGRQSRVEDGGHRPGSGDGGGKTFADLPKDAKDTARSQVPKFVGPGKAFKTEKEWFKHYADTYYA